MGDRTGIQWTDASLNPIAAYDVATGKRGWFCVHASPGCVNCYAERLNRFRGNGHAYRVPEQAKVRMEIVEHILLQPLAWERPRRIFMCSMTDLFLDAHSDEMIDRIVAMMGLAERHTFQVLTKRADRMLDYMSQLQTMSGKLTPGGALRMNRAVQSLSAKSGPVPGVWPLPNVWLGVSTEDQMRADQRIPALLDTPAAVRFLSIEPQIGPVLLRGYPRGFLDWIIIGGESGKHARPFHYDWAESLIVQARTVDAKVFMKQVGAKPVNFGGAEPLVLKDSHGGDPTEWPLQLRLREFPRARQAPVAA